MLPILGRPGGSELAAGNLAWPLVRARYDGNVCPTEASQC